MQSTNMWLANQRAVDARERAAVDRMVRTARRATGQRSLLDRIRGRQ